MIIIAIGLQGFGLILVIIGVGGKIITALERIATALEDKDA